MEALQMYVNGKWEDSSNKEVINVTNPSTGKVMATIPRGDHGEVDRAVNAAKDSFVSEEWRRFKPFERGRLLYDVAGKLKENRDELARLETMDVGKPLSQGYADIDAAIRYFEFYGGAADKVMGDTIPIEDGLIDYVIREPIGVTAHIVPWNYPIQILSRSVAAAIAMGNTVVVKSAEDTPLTASRIAEYFDQTDLPKGVFNHITGYGHEAGAALSSHPLINHLTFTGSVGTGTAVATAATSNVVPVTLELGGKSPNIVFSDCDIDKAVEGVVKAIIQNAGQTCSAGSRLLVEESFKETFLNKLVDRFNTLSVGPALDDYDVGPILNQKQFDRIQDFMALAEQEGTVLTGGKRINYEKYENACYMAPTIIDDLSLNSKLAQEEIFGPVLSVFTFKNEQEAIEMANSTDYGLVTGIWTRDINKAHLLMSRIDSGQVFINNYGAGGGIQMPFGGYKKSGFGREKGWIALYNYTQVKNVAIKFD
ncbi:aldehyde dehydrogenase [Lentibacillus kapialis]|uniref:Aldehyde dehydrogenase n=1 Tax=Lentibacillus kapialis TaxID=340214 RepID=A0A917PVH9_9BACI|nr:aldehyde dehydrogenase family protein [Lentibacillus kapialis]GGJ93836.1 aldehyde dehydrogenase [Lentibacillus kapialis]